MTPSTHASSLCDAQSLCSDQDANSAERTVSLAQPIAKKASAIQTIDQNSGTNQKSNASKIEGGWKKKVKTELCHFWLKGQECENSSKEQGCGFAHGQDEL